jgi:DNA topoisomerase/Toprim domain
VLGVGSVLIIAPDREQMRLDLLQFGRREFAEGASRATCARSGLVPNPISFAASIRPWPAMLSPSSPTSTGLVKPNRRMLSAICRTCFLEWVRESPLPAVRQKVGAKGQLAQSRCSLYVLIGSFESILPNEPVMADQIVITEKSNQAKDVRVAVGSRYGEILAAEGHLFDLLEPEDVVPAWKRWSPILLRPEGLYGTRPAVGGNKAAKLRAIREALRNAKRVWLATDCDREGQLIGQEILEHYEYRGQVMRVLFTAQDSQTIRDAFGRAKPNSEYARLYAAAVARRQADQIYNLSLTRTATVILGQGARRVIGVGRVKTPTLAIVCKRELEIRNFVPIAYFEIVATAEVAGGQFQMQHAPQERIVRREIAQDVVNAAQGFEGALAVGVEDKRQGPPKLHDLPSLQKLCGSRFGWPASKTLEVAQRRSSMMARAKRSSPIRAPRCATCRRA